MKCMGACGADGEVIGYVLGEEIYLCDECAEHHSRYIKLVKESVNSVDSKTDEGASSSAV